MGAAEGDPRFGNEIGFVLEIRLSAIIAEEIEFLGKLDGIGA